MNWTVLFTNPVFDAFLTVVVICVCSTITSVVGRIADLRAHEADAYRDSARAEAADETAEEIHPDA